MPVPRRVSEMIYAALRERLPWLVAEWNGVEWEAERTVVRRRLRAIESHLRNLEDRYADMENRHNDHAQGRKHKPARDMLPAPDAEWVFPPHMSHTDEATGIEE